MSISTHAIISWLLLTASICVAAEKVERLQFNVNDEQGRPLPCRIHLADQQRQPVQAAGKPFFRDHFVCSGRVALDLAPGTYHYTIARGPEYEEKSGSVTLPLDPTQSVSVTLGRIADMRRRHWYSADLHVHRPVEDIEQLMLAEDLDFAPVITWWNQRDLWRDKDVPAEVLVQFDGHRLYHLMAGEDEREGGALMYFGLSRPLDITVATRENPSPLDFLNRARQRNSRVWVDIEKPFWWDVPTWLASGKVHSIGLANNHMCRSQMLAGEAWGKPRDDARLPSPLGNGYWTQEIYYHILNSGLRIPPSAGSASGVLPNPVGYNRVYVHPDGDFTHDTWWEGLRKGRCFVTNGPLLVCRANGELPGSVLQSAGPFQARLQIDLTSRDRIRAVEVIRNGRVAKTLETTNVATQQLTDEIELDESGWFLIRAITDNDQTFRFASSAPFYVEIGEKTQHVSEESVEFFLSWVEQRIARVKRNLANDPEALRSVLRYHENALEFWRQRAAMAQQ